MFFRKKTILTFLLLFLSLTQVSYADEIKVGTVINKVLSTDIKAFVNGYQIPSMNIDGNTVIVAEDLRNYGFDVIWNPGDRSLRITENLSKKIKPITIENATNEEIGEILGDVLCTDIRTYIGSREVQSFNIGGYTTILIRELEEWGSIKWDEEKREVRFVSDNIGNRVQIDDDNQFGFKINQTSLTQMILENKGNRYYYEGKEVGFYDGPAMLSLKTLADKFGYVFLNEDGCFTLKRESYSFKIRGNDKKVQKFFDGKLFEEIELWHKPAYLNNDLFVADVDLSDLFGLNKHWDVETKSIYLYYPEYDVDDYGNYEILGEAFVVKAVGKSGPSIRILNKTINHESFAHGFYNRDKARFELESRAPLSYGDNELDIAVVYKGRILLLKTLKNIRPNLKNYKIQNEKSIGPWTSIKIESPQTGYIETNTGQFKINGEIINAIGDSLTVEIEKLNEHTNKYESLTPQSLSIKDNSFYGYIDLESGYGIYRVKVFANVTGLHGHKGNTMAFEFFINYLR